MDDLLGLSSGYAPIIALALLIVFSVMAMIQHKRAIATPWLYPLAGLLAMHPIFNITLIAGARSPWGFTAQCLTDLVGGWVFMHLENTK